MLPCFNARKTGHATNAKTKMARKATTTQLCANPTPTPIAKMN
jgi:hypothetical protein